MANSTLAETVTVRLAGRYDGWYAEMIADPEWGYIADIQSGQADRIASGLANCVVKWNFTDRSGQPLDPVAESIYRVPRGAVIQLMDRYSDLYRALPND